MILRWARSRSGEAFRNQATTDFDPGGGYTVVPEIETSIDRIATKNSAFRPLARITSISSAAYKELVGQGGATGGWVGERDSRDETDTPKLEQIEITAEEQYAEPAASQDLLDDSGIDIAAWLAEEVGITLAEKEAEAFISGNGVKKPRGILSYPMVANANYVWGKIGFVKSGHDGALDPATGGDVLIDLIHGLKAKYRANGTFLANDLTIAEIRKLKTDTGYLWQPSLQAGQPSLLLGYPIQSDDFMPDLAADSYSLAFADFNSAYRIVDRQGIKVLQDPYTKKGFVLFYTTRRVGGGIRNFEAIKFLKFGD